MILLMSNLGILVKEYFNKYIIIVKKDKLYNK